MSESQPQFTYSKAQFRGTMIIVVILVFIFVLPDVIVYCSKSEPFSIQLLPRKEAEAYRRVMKRSKSGYRFKKRESRYLLPPEKFNPNDYTVEQWMALGLSEKQSKVILKFTKYRLKSNDDLKRIFVINDELFQLIKDSTVYDAQPVRMDYTETRFHKESPRQIHINLNQATVEELMTVPGIGNYFAKKIVEYREHLGGFYDINQLLEVYRVDQEKLTKWTPYLEVNPADIKQLSLNSGTAEELQKHPYISWNLANSLVKLRQQKGYYKRVEDSKQSVLMTQELYQKLKYYLKTE